MSPEDEALRAERLGRTLLSTYDQAEAELLRSRIEQLRASSQEVGRKADNVRSLLSG